MFPLNITCFSQILNKFFVDVMQRRPLFFERCQGGRRGQLNSSLKCNKVDILGEGLKRGEPVEAFAWC